MMPTATPKRAEAFTRHGYDRYREFYPTATEAEMLAVVERSTPTDAATIYPLVNRPGQRSHDNDRWYVHPDRTGAFVVKGPTVVTFYRFYSEVQRRRARELFDGKALPPEVKKCPPAKPPSPRLVPVSNGVAKVLGGRARVREEMKRPLVPCSDGFVARRRDSSWATIDRAWRVDGHLIAVVDGRVVLVTPWKNTALSKEDSDCPVGRLALVGVTERMMEIYGASRSDPRHSRKSTRGRIRSAVAEGEWSDVGGRYRVTTPDGTWWVVEEIPGQWVVCTKPPPEMTETERAAHSVLAGAGWKMFRGEWDGVIHSAPVAPS